MTDLLLIFLLAAFLEHVALVMYHDSHQQLQRVIAWQVVVSALLFTAFALHWSGDLLAVGPAARRYLLVLTFIATGIAVADGCASATRDIGANATLATRRVRQSLPLVVGLLALVAFAILDPHRPHPPRETLHAALLASACLSAIMLVWPALRARLDDARRPAVLSGWPVTLLTSALVALALVGLLGPLG